MIKKVACTFAFLIGLVILVKSIAVFSSPAQEVGFVRGGMFANTMDLVASGTLLVFVLLSVLSSARWFWSRSSAIVVLSLLLAAAAVQFGYAVAYPDIRTDLVLGACLHMAAAFAVFLCRQEQFLTSRNAATK